MQSFCTLIFPTCQTFLTGSVQKINFRTQILLSHCCHLKYWSLFSRRQRAARLADTAQRCRQRWPRSPAVPLDSAENATIHLKCFGYSAIVALSVYFGAMLIVTVSYAGTCCCRCFPWRAANSIYSKIFLHDCLLLDTAQWQLLHSKRKILATLNCFVDIALPWMGKESAEKYLCNIYKMMKPIKKNKFIFHILQLTPTATKTIYKFVHVNNPKGRSHKIYEYIQTLTKWNFTQCRKLTYTIRYAFDFHSDFIAKQKSVR